MYTMPTQSRKKVDTAVLISNKVDFKSLSWKPFPETEKSLTIKKKKSVFQEDLTILNLYGPNNLTWNNTNFKMTDHRNKWIHILSRS